MSIEWGPDPANDGEYLQKIIFRTSTNIFDEDLPIDTRMFMPVKILQSHILDRHGNVETDHEFKANQDAVFCRACTPSKESTHNTNEFRYGGTCWGLTYGWETKEQQRACGCNG